MAVALLYAVAAKEVNIMETDEIKVIGGSNASKTEGLLLLIFVLVRCLFVKLNCLHALIR